MFNIANLPAVRAQLAQDAAGMKTAAGGPPSNPKEQESVLPQPGQIRAYPSKNLVLDGGRYRAVEQEK